MTLTLTLTLVGPGRAQLHDAKALDVMVWGLSSEVTVHREVAASALANFALLPKHQLLILIWSKSIQHITACKMIVLLLM